VLVDNPEITFVTPLDWSPDGRTVVVRLGRADRTARLALVSTASDQLSELKSIDWQGPIEAAFSPDGRFIAYDAVADEKTGQRDILLLSTDATREERVVQSPFSDVVAGWSPDGRLLLFLSNRSGANAVFGQAIADGRAVGAPTLLRADLGTLARIVGTTRTGALFVVQRTSAFQVHTATVDFATGAVLTPGAPVLETYLQGQRFPVWSPDGKQLAWSSPLKSGQPGVGATVLSLETGRATEIAAELAYGVLRAWAPDGGLTYQGSDLKGRHGLFRVDPRDGRTTAIALANDGFFSLPSWSGDGRYIVYRNQVPKSPGMILRDMVTGTERELVRSRPFGYLALAPDGKHVAFTEGSTTPHSILLIAVDTGETREVFRVPDTEIVATFHWLPDSRRLVVWKSVGDKSTGAVISLAGGPPVPLDPAIPAELQMHPDGRRIAYTAGTRTLELWAHEHFLPAATAQ
jgi:Tol biopolymer transport system component